MRLVLTGLTVAILSACAASNHDSNGHAQTDPPRASTTQPASQYAVQFATIADAAWDYHSAQRHPVDELLDISPQALQQRHATRLEFYQQLENIDPQRLSADDRINRHMIMYALANAIDEYEFNAHLMPITNEYGFHSAMANLPNQANPRNREDLENYLNRLRAIPAYFGQQVAYMRQGLETGMTQPAVVLEGLTEGILAYVTSDPRDSVFYRPFAERPRHISEADFAELEMEAQTIIATQVNSAYQDFYDFMRDEYIPNTRQTIAAINLPHGERYYANRAKHYTTTELTPQQIHQIGLDEVARIRAEMQEVIADSGFNGSFEDFTEYLRSDPKFYAQTAEELLKEASYIAKRADAQLPALFKLLPRQPYGVTEVPAEIAPNYTTGRYSGSNRDDRAGYYWVNTYALDRRPLYELEALTLHEAVPGHHLQIALAGEMEGVPSYRQNTYISAFGEGWGLYAEYLGLEMGFYSDPYSNFGRLSFEMWRAARLVVDTGMHTMGWSRDRAVDFMAGNTALSMHNVNTEIDRYISWPGQALAYKLGEIKIRELRAQAEERLGEHFDIRDFHHQVLRHGSIPLHILEANLQAYIDEQVNEHAAL